VVQMSVEVADGLAALHELDIVHRDLKPSNILFDQNGHAKVADLGLAQAHSSDSLRSQLSNPRPHPGTPAYMSPEQENTNKYLTPASDVYALGLVLFEVLTGRVYRNQRPGTRARELRQDVPLWLDALLARMLSPEPEKRPWNGREAMALLRAGSDEKTTGQPVQLAEPDHLASAERPAMGAVEAPPPTPLVPPGPSHNIRHWGGWLGMAGLILVALVIILLVVFQMGKGSGAAPASPPVGAQTPGLTESITQTQVPIATEISASTPLPVPTELPAPSDTPTQAPLPTFTGIPSLGIGSSWVRPADGMVMMYVPQGAFTMGDTNEQAMAECQQVATDCKPDYFTDEQPPHSVVLEAFWIDKTELTNEMYAKCVNAGACQAPSSPSSNTRTSYYGNPQYDNYPVIFVNWQDAHDYCAWAGTRLPSEVEWEKAARGTDERAFPWGNSSPDANLANFKSKDTVAVGSYPSGASPYGVLDMAGNVWNWLNDWYGVYPGGDPAGSPFFGTQWRTMRGGPWASLGGTSLRSAYRGSDYPVNSTSRLGFRCARNAP